VRLAPSSLESALPELYEAVRYHRLGAAIDTEYLLLPSKPVLRIPTRLLVLAQGAMGAEHPLQDPDVVLVARSEASPETSLEFAALFEGV